MSDLTIRPIEARDRVEWDSLFTAYLSFYETERPQEVYDIAFERLLSGKAGEFRGLIAENGGQAVGFTHYLYHRHMWAEAMSCYLQDLYVSEAARGTGAGRALIKAVHAAAKAEGCTNVYWMTQEFNETARKLYDRVAELTPFIKYNMPI